MTEQKYWTEIISEILANIHPHEIEEGIIKPAIDQVILDYEDSLNLYDEEYDDEALTLTKELIKKWKKIKRKVRKRA